MRNWIQFSSVSDMLILLRSLPKSPDTKYLCLSAHSLITMTILSLQGCKTSTICRPTTSRLRWSSVVTSIRWPRLSKRSGRTTRKHFSSTCGRYASRRASHCRCAKERNASSIVRQRKTYRFRGRVMLLILPFYEYNYDIDPYVY